MKRILLVLLCSLIFPACTHALTYYVATTGSNSTSCTAAQNPTTPKLTLAAGIACLSAGDTLVVKPGTYNEQVRDLLPSGTAGSPTTLRSEIQHGAIIRPQASSSSCCGGLQIGAGNSARTYITVDGFVIDLADQPTFAPINCIVDIEHRTGTNNILIQNNELKNLPSAFAGSGGGGICNEARSVTFRANVIHHISESFDDNKVHGIYETGIGNTYEGNHIYQIQAFGIHGFNISPTSVMSDNTYRNNLIHDTIHRGGIFLGSGSRELAVGNIVHTTNGHGIQLGGFCSPEGCPNSAVYNNTVYNRHSARSA